MAYHKNMPEWYVNRPPVVLLTDAEKAASMAKFAEHVAFWQRAKEEATFSEERNAAGFPAFYYIAGETFQFSSASDRQVWYAKVGEPSVKRIFTRDMERVDIGLFLCEMAAQGYFQAK